MHQNYDIESFRLGKLYQEILKEFKGKSEPTHVPEDIFIRIASGALKNTPLMKELLRCSHWRISSSSWTYTNSCLPRRVHQAASSKTWFLELLLILEAGAIYLERDMECSTQFRPLWTTYKKVQSLCNRTWSATKNHDNLANSILPILKWTKSNVRS